VRWVLELDRGVCETSRHSEAAVFPIRDDNPQILTPIVTIGLIIANVLAWALIQGFGNSAPLTASVCELGLIPAELLGSLPAGTTVPMGDGLACVLSVDPAKITLLSHMFLHGGWLHLIGNLWFLWIFGDNVEDSMGHVRFLVFYLLCGFAAAGLQLYSNPDSRVPMVGASGAIGGVMGAYVILYPRVWVHMLLWFGFYVTRIAIPAYFMLGYWFAIQLVGGAVSAGQEGGGVAFWAHVGGFAAGALLIPVFRNPDLLRRHPYYGWKQKPIHRGYYSVLNQRGRRR
jgi:membrane associated rhomboid family serine protease